jgi:hypothetical protein
MRFITLSIALLLSAFTQSGVAQEKTNPPAEADSKQQYRAVLEELRKNPDFNQMPLIDFDTTLLPDDSHTREVRKLMEQLGVMKMAVTQGELALKAQMQDNNPFLQEFFARFSSELHSGRIYKMMENLITGIYRKNFTLEEVLQLEAFYATPLGKKTISILPEITQEGAREGEKIGRYMGKVLVFEMIRESSK